MFDYAAVFEPENVHNGHTAVAGFTDEMAVCYDQVAFSEDALELEAE